MRLAFGQLLQQGYGAFTGVRNLSLALILSAGAIKAEPVVIAALGDSLTHGYGLPVDQGFVPQMQAWLTAEGVDVTLINAGVSGDTTAGGLSRVAWTLTPEVDALIVALGANDYLRGIEPSVARANLQGILEVAKSQDVDVMIVGLDVGANYGSEYKAEFDAIYPELSDEFEALYFRSFFAGLEGASESILGMAKFFQPDGLHPNAAGVEKIVAAMGPKIAELAERAQ